MTQTSRPQVEAYLDYRILIQHWVAFLRESDPAFSLRALSLKSGLSLGSLSMLFSGQLNLSFKAFEKLKGALDMKRPELEILEDLYQMSESPDPLSRERALERLAQNSSFREKHGASLRAYRYLGDADYVRFRELLLLEDFSEDLAWVNRHWPSRLTQPRLQKMVADLLGWGLVRRDQQGRLQPYDERVQCEGGIHQLTLHKFHREMLGEASRSIENFSKDERNLQGLSLALAESDLPLVNKIIEEALDKIEALRKWPDRKKATAVYHVEMLSFPLTRLRAKKGD